jgi:FUN14 domain-containing protein 1
MTTVDWKSMASRYDSVVDGVAGAGLGSRFKRLSSRVLDFLMADFPPRATFAAGLALGLRIG